MRTTTLLNDRMKYSEATQASSSLLATYDVRPGARARDAAELIF